jgi:hypothetical protein
MAYFGRLGRIGRRASSAWRCLGQKDGVLLKQYDDWGADGADPPAQAQRLTQRCAGTAGGIALLTLAAWLTDARFLAGQWGGAIPMAPSTALALLFLSGGVYSRARWPARHLAPPIRKRLPMPICWGGCRYSLFLG